ncbi:hypothetical protein GCM10027037_08440 [Mucilaginibacter koreensis]
MTNVINVTPSSPINGIHEILTDSKRVDPYGGFPLAAPDGSHSIIKLGNNGSGQQAERVTYDFVVPTGQNNFVLTYQYAVVLEDPQHTASEQPRFTAKVLDLNSNTYITCASFDYVATSSLPGFKSANGVVYKSWTPVTINLTGYQGKKLRLEFTTADCTQGGHFGYAYIDVNENCSNLITGNVFCGNANKVTLNGPFGYDKYNWYNSDKSKLLGTGSSFTFATPPADGTIINLDIIPFAGYGCPTSTSTVMQYQPFNFVVNAPAPVCFPLTVDLTDSKLVKIDDPTATITYWTDAAGTQALSNPKAVSVSGTYYVKASNKTGCVSTQPMNVVVNALPDIKITDPPQICPVVAIDLTQPTVTAGSTANLIYTYWTDAACTKALAKPAAVTVTGTYYIKGTTSSGCFTIKPVHVSFYTLPVLKITDPAAVCYPSTVDITTAAITTGSDANLVLTYWLDAQTTKVLNTPNAVPASGTYYIKATNANGCETVLPVHVVVNPLPNLVVTNPADVCLPATVNLSASAVTAGSSNVAQLTYWRDEKATVPLSNFKSVADSGLYYIKATTSLGCETVKPVLVTIHKLPVLIVTPPAKLYQPSTINITLPALTTGSSPNLKFTYWTSTSFTTKVDHPEAVAKTGTYYIMAENTYGCTSVAPVDLVLAPIPNILVPKAFTPTQLTNSKLYPFLVGIQQFKYFRVYNKWGNIVFETKDASADKGWDGVYKGAIQFMDTFTWEAEGYDYVGNLVHRSGNSILLK